MLTSLIIGCVTVVISMGIQVVAVVQLLRYLMRKLQGKGKTLQGFSFDLYIISIVLLMLFVGHMVQIGIWAGLFMYLDEFGDFVTAFYHSTVNFSSLGYGDIVMSEEWRLLGALEATNGVLMFGLSSGTIIAVMTGIFSRHDWSGKSSGD